MEENDNLDNFIADIEQATAENPVQQHPAPHPKLKKIKRPKIRPASDIPAAPQKASPIKEEAPVQQEKAAPTLADEDREAETSVSPTGTQLMTATAAQDITSNRVSDNSYILEDLPPELDYITDDNGSAIYTESSSSIKKLAAISILCFLFGVFIGSFFFSSKTEEKHGLEDVVLNPDVPQGRARCGLTEKSQACIFYVMNCYKQELTGRDFYKLAATLTGREEYVIESENLRYSAVKIKPGAFAQLNIPALK